MTELFTQVVPAFRRQVVQAILLLCRVQKLPLRVGITLRFREVQEIGVKVKNLLNGKRL
jgi:hypothetical protein